MRFTNCSGCLAGEYLASVIGFAAESIQERRQRLKIRARHFADLKLLGLSDDAALDWRELGFTPSQAAQLIQGGVKFGTVLDEWADSGSTNAVFRIFVRADYPASRIRVGRTVVVWIMAA